MVEVKAVLGECRLGKEGLWSSRRSFNRRR
jgi:hypothetical protein